ncbi:FAD-dependent monooxygenase [Nonomuraea longispora]|uniref:FAD-dependent monooxygenase n=1 Tax=Nonomuraea longispora TaxID=1848320 RepID=UPI001C700C4F|nr:FAD-dependent monooxygenase [Nonomuraea longispora]
MTHVLIVGGGPTGLTLAVELARRNVDFRLVERSPQPAAGVRAKVLQPRTLEIFDDLGIIDEILATGGEYPPMRAYQADRVVWEGRMDRVRQATPDMPYPNTIVQPQWRTESILRARLAELGHHVEFGAELTDFVQDTSHVTATLSTGETLECAYLVGADGGRSFVRKRLGIGFAGHTNTHEHILLADVKTRDLDREHYHMWAREDQDKHLSLCPLPHTDIFQAIIAYEDSESLAAVMAAYAPHIRVGEILWWSEYRVNVRLADRFRVGRVFLAGDAAHVHSPAGAQGLNTGVQDAYNLGWKLTVGTPALLDTYEIERRPVAADILELSSRLHRDKNAVLGAATDQLRLAYPDSPLSVGERGGQRLGRHFAEQRGTGFLLLGDTDRDYGMRVIPPLPDEHGVTLVRPDGYVAYHGEETELATFLARFGLATPASDRSG